MKKITKKMMIGEILAQNPDLGEVLIEHGFGCVGCAMAGMETLEEGAKAHGMANEDIKVLVETLNERIDPAKA